MGECEPRWYDEPRWYYVGNGQRRFRDGNGWTDRYEDIDSPTQTPATGPPEHPQHPVSFEPAVAGAGRLGAAGRLLRSVTGGDRGEGMRRRVRSRSRGGSPGLLGGAQPDGPAALSPESLLPGSMSPEWQAALRVGAGHPSLPGVRFSTRDAE